MWTIIRTIEHGEQRYDTAGDWLFSGDKVLHVWVSKMPDYRYEYLLAIHELVEAMLCRAAGVSQESVDAFDLSWEGEGEPGDDEAAPYHAQHIAASELEMRLAHLLGVDWRAYVDAVEGLSK